MFHICFAADENYIKYTAVLITSIVKATDTSRKFKDFFETKADSKNADSFANATKADTALNADTLATKRERESKSHTPHNEALTAQNPTTQHSLTSHTSLKFYKKLDYETLSDDEKSEGYIFHILTDKISESTQQKLENLAKNLSEIYPCEIQVHICDDSIFGDFPKWRGNYLAYFRFFIPNLMPQGLKMSLYLDTDMLVLGDLRGLFALDLNGKVLGAVMNDLDGVLECKTLDVHNGDFYFNSGFLLMNLQEWQKQDIQKGCFDFLRDFEALFPDQDALNYAISKDKVLLLPLQYNLSRGYYHCTRKNGYTREQNTFALMYPAILHFKPWWADFAVQNEGLDCHFNLFWLDIAVQTPFYRDFEPLLQSYERARVETKYEKARVETKIETKIITSKTLKRFLKIAAKILPSSKARKQCRRLLSEC